MFVYKCYKNSIRTRPNEMEHIEIKPADSSSWTHRVNKSIDFPVAILIISPSIYTFMFVCMFRILFLHSLLCSLFCLQHMSISIECRA